MGEQDVSMDGFKPLGESHLAGLLILLHAGFVNKISYTHLQKGKLMTVYSFLSYSICFAMS